MIVVLSLAAAAFLVVQERGARDAAAIENHALSASGTPTPHEIRTAQDQLKPATRWNPDTDPLVNLGVLQVRAGRFKAGGANLAKVTAKEPENAQAWSLLAFAAQHYDSDLAAIAEARARTLEPPVPLAR